MAGKSKELEKLKQTKKGLVDSLTKVVCDAAGDIVESALSRFEKSSGAGAASTSSPVLPAYVASEGRRYSCSSSEY